MQSMWLIHYILSFLKLNNSFDSRTDWNLSAPYQRYCVWSGVNEICELWWKFSGNKNLNLVCSSHKIIIRHSTQVLLWCFFVLSGVWYSPVTVVIIKRARWTFCETSLFVFLVWSISLSCSLWSKSPSMEELCHIGFHERSYLRLLCVFSTVTGAWRGPPRARRVWWRFCALDLTVSRFGGITIFFSVGSVCGGHGLW